MIIVSLFFWMVKKKKMRVFLFLSFLYPFFYQFFFFFVTKSQFNHVFLVVSIDRKKTEETKKTHYRVACSLREGMHTFGPRLVKPPIYEKGNGFKEFLLSKCINGEKASKFAPDFLQKRAHLREWFLNNLIDKAAKSESIF